MELERYNLRKVLVSLNPFGDIFMNKKCRNATIFTFKLLLKSIRFAIIIGEGAREVEIQDITSSWVLVDILN